MNTYQNPKTELMTVSAYAAVLSTSAGTGTNPYLMEYEEAEPGVQF